MNHPQTDNIMLNVRWDILVYD